MIWLLISFVIKLNPIVTELFVGGRTLKTSFVFKTQSYFAAPKNNKLSSTHYFLWKFQTQEHFNKFHLIIDQILIFKILWIFIKSVLQKYILF